MLVENVVIVGRLDLGGKRSPRRDFAELVDIQTIAFEELLGLWPRNIAWKLRQGAVKHQIFDPKQSGKTAIVAAERVWIMPQGKILGILSGADRAFVIVDAQGIIAERIFQFEDHRRILPGPFEPEDLNARPLAVAHHGGDVLAQSRDASGVGRLHAGIDSIALEGLRIERRGAIAPEDFGAA